MDFTNVTEPRSEGEEEELNPDINEDEMDNIEGEGGDAHQKAVDVNEGGIGDQNENENEGKEVFAKMKRKKISVAHLDFSAFTTDAGVKKWKCNHCKALFAVTNTGTTSHLLNHRGKCFQKKLHNETQKTLQFQPANSKFEMNPLSDGRYDHSKQREAIAHWILMHEQPFNVVENYGFSLMFKVNLPQFEKISRATTRNDVITVYDIEKKKLLLMLKNVSKISLTTDIWKSKVKKISYMCVT